MEIALNRAIPKEATVNRSAPGVLKAVKCLDHQKWFFCFQKIRHSKVQIVDIIYSHCMEVPAHCWYSGYFRIFGNMPIKILVLVVKVRIIDVSVDRTSIFTSKCIQQDKLTTRTPATTYRWTAMNLLCHRVARLKCTWLHKLYANHYSNRHRLLQIHREIWKLANRH